MFINRDFMTSITFMFEPMSRLSISQMIRFYILICVICKMLNGLLPKYLCNNLILTNTVHDYDGATRQNNEYNLMLPNYSSTFVQNNIFL